MAQFPVASSSKTFGKRKFEDASSVPGSFFPKPNHRPFPGPIASGVLSDTDSITFHFQLRYNEELELSEGGRKCPLDSTYSSLERLQNGSIFPSAFDDTKPPSLDSPVWALPMNSSNHPFHLPLSLKSFQLHREEDRRGLLGGRGQEQQNWGCIRITIPGFSMLVPKSMQSDSKNKGSNVKTSSGVLEACICLRCGDIKIEYGTKPIDMMIHAPCTRGKNALTKSEDDFYWFSPRKLTDLPHAIARILLYRAVNGANVDGNEDWGGC